MSKNSGFSLMDLIVSMFLISIVTAISYKYLSNQMKSLSTAKGYMNQEEVSHFIEKFFRRDNQCTTTLQKAEQASGVTGGGDFTIKELVSVKTDGTEQTAQFFFQGLKKKLVGGGIDVSFFPLKNNREIAKFDYTVRETDEKTGQLEEKKRTFQTEILRNIKGEIDKCLGSSHAVEYCKAGHQHILSYDESSLNPITTSTIENNQPHGTVHKTLTKNMFDDATGVSCLSYTSCNQGQWNSSAYCYNSCTDEVWSNDEDSYRDINSKNCAEGQKSLGQLVECKTKKGFLCEPKALTLPSCSIDLSEYCVHNRTKVVPPCPPPPPCPPKPLPCPPPPPCPPPYYKYKPSWIKSTCESGDPKFVSPSSPFSLPKGNYGEAAPFRRSIKKNNLTFGYISVYARCEYSGTWQIMGASCDEHPAMRPGGRPKNIWGRKKQSGTCWAEYPPPQFSCNTNKDITLKPNITADSRGPIPPEDISIKEIYNNKIADRVEHGVPLRFVFDFKGRNSVSYTVACNSKTGNFEVLNQSKYCFHTARKADLDMIFVIDNSGSMRDEQRNLATNLNRFLDQFLSNDVNYHITVLTSKPSGQDNRIKGGFICNYKNCPGKKINKITKAKLILKIAIDNAGTKGGHEKFFRPVVELRKKYPDFFRKNASLALFFLSDEDDQSLFSIDDFMKFLFGTKQIKGASGLDRQSRKNTIVFVGLNDPSSKKIHGGKNCANASVSHKRSLKGPRNEPIVIRSFMTKIDEVSVFDPMRYKSPNEVDLCNPRFSDRLQDFGVSLASLLRIVKPPQRPNTLNVLDKDSLPSELKTGSGHLNIDCH